MEILGWSCQVTDLNVVMSTGGEITLKAKVTDRVMPGALFIPFHFHESPANILTIAALDPIAKIPELKVCAINIENTATWSNLPNTRVWRRLLRRRTLGHAHETRVRKIVDRDTNDLPALRPQRV